MLKMGPGNQCTAKLNKSNQLIIGLSYARVPPIGHEATT
jgi:hypothetical protein